MTAHDWALVEAAHTDRAAFAELYRAHRDMVYRFARTRVHHHELAEDITADTFVRALAHIDRVQDTGHTYGAWLLTIARNLIRDHWKASRTHRETSVAEYPDVAIPGQRCATDHVDDALILAGVFARLPENDRVILADRFVRGLSVTEAAEAGGCSIGATKTRQARALERLRQRLGVAS